MAFSIFPSASSAAIPDNLRWFAMIYLFGTVGAMIVMGVLASMGVDLPGAGVSAGLFFGIVALAVQRLAKVREIPKPERTKLALGYMLIALAISLFLLGLLLVLAVVLAGPEMLAQMIPLNAQMLGIFAIALIAVSLLYFGGARFVVGIVAQRTIRESNS
ncbi:MAG: ABZJ_00895 family protein [Caulobacterales bacterium]